MLETLDGDVLTLRSGHASGDFLIKLNNLRKCDLFLDVNLMILHYSNALNGNYIRPNGNGNGAVEEVVQEKSDENVNVIKAHKVVLCCCSPYFEKMFSVNFLEKNKSVVEIGGCLDFSAFEQMINFFYTGILRINATNAIDLLQVADILLLEQTKNCVLKYMQQTLNSGNCILYKNVGHTFACQSLEETADRFARRNFEDVCKCDNFLNISFQELKSFFEMSETKDVNKNSPNNDDALFVKSEDTLAHAVLRWMDNQKSSAESNADKHSLLEKLITYINWRDVSEETLQHFSRTYPNIIPIKSSAINASQNITHPAPGFVTTGRRPRRCAKSQWIVVGGFDSRNLEYIDTSNMTRGWAKLTEIPGPGMRYGMSGAGLAVHSQSGNIFVVGGVGKGAILQAVATALVYDVRTNSWSMASSMNKSRKCHGSTVCGNRLYAVGGTDSRLTVTTTEFLEIGNGISTSPILSPATHTAGSIQQNNATKEIKMPLTVNDAPPSEWKELSMRENLDDILTHGGGTSLVAIDSILFALSIYGTVENDRMYYATREDARWMRLPIEGDGRLPRDRPGMGHHLGLLIVAGGSMDRNLLRSVEQYDLRNNTWSRMPDLNLAREGPAVVSIENRLWIIGGKTDSENEKLQGTVEIFDEESQMWILQNEERGLNLKINKNQECLAVVMDRVVS